jgi:branched-chain amino acid transport system substrate-binding protein
MKKQLNARKNWLLPVAGTLALAGMVMADKVGSPIPIGFSVAQTSNTALLGKEQVIGAQIAEEFFNGRGGINGTPFKLFFEDTGGDEAGAINAFQTQINKNKVVGIVGPTLSQQAFAADKIAEQAKVPVLGPSNTAKGIPEIGDFIARVSAPVAIVAPNSVKAALKLNPAAKKAAVMFAQNDAFSTSETGTFQETAKAQGLEITTVQKFQTTDTDFTTQVTAALATSPDIIIVSGLAADGGNLIKQLRLAGYKGILIGGNGLNTANMFPVCQQYCDGVLIAQAYSPTASGVLNAAFRTVYKNKYKKEPPQFTAQAFAAVQVMVEALRAVDKKAKVNDTELADVRIALNAQILKGKYNTPLGEISFTSIGEVNQKLFYVAQIKMNADGKTGSFSYLK